MNDKNNIANRATAYEIRKVARDKLSNHWVKIFLGVLCYFTMVTFMTTLISAFYPGAIYYADTGQRGVFPWIPVLYQIMILGPMNVGIMSFFIRFNRNGEIQYGSLFSGFKSPLKPIGMSIIKAILVCWPMILVCVCAFAYLVVFANTDNIGSIVLYDHTFFLIIMVVLLAAFVISMIYAVYTELKYSMAYYIMADDRTKKITVSLAESERLMEGKKNELLYLVITYIGWLFIAVIPAVALTALMSFIFPSHYPQLISIPVALSSMICYIPLMLVNCYILVGITEFYMALIQDPNIKENQDNNKEKVI